jgi:VanZ family protein
MLAVRYPWVWLSLGWLLVLSVIVGSLVPGEMLRAITLSDKIMHAGSYFVLMVWFAGLYHRSKHPILAAVLIGLGIALDMLQGATRTRTFDLQDIGADAAGVLAGLLLSIWFFEGWCLRLERYLVASA